MGINKLVIIGAGGHGKVVADAAQESRCWDEIVFLDDNWREIGTQCGISVIGPISALAGLRVRYTDALVAVGDNARRMSLLDQAVAAGFALPALVHPRAYVSRHAVVGAGSVVLAQAVINADARLGRGVIVNTGAVVEHDCDLGDGVHLSPGVHLGGRVTIGELTWVGIGAAVRDKLRLGDRVTVGAGSVVVKNLPDDALVYGEAARTRPLAGDTVPSED